MTPDYILTIALRRSGYHNPTPEQKTNARDYLNMIKTELEGETTWRFLYKVGSITTVADQREYSLASDVLEPGGFFDYTNGRPISTVHPSDVDDADPDQDFDGEPGRVALTSLNTTTGYWQVDLYPTPDTAGDEIKYRYYATLADLVAGDDDTDLAPKYPRYIQAPLLWGTCGMYKGEKENDSEAFEWQRYSASKKNALAINRRLAVPQRIQMPSSVDTSSFLIHGAVQVD
uniref:Uncharacterized protein n=1 Tax=viral metagenome TaxID=1070528 RepID=A0A6M3KN56_9ZZZZ